MFFLALRSITTAFCSIEYDFPVRIGYTRIQVNSLLTTEVCFSN